MLLNDIIAYTFDAKKPDLNTQKIKNDTMLFQGCMGRLLHFFYELEQKIFFLKTSMLIYKDLECKSFKHDRKLWLLGTIWDNVKKGSFLVDTEPYTLTF